MLIDLIAQNWADAKIRAFTDVQSTPPHISLPPELTDAMDDMRQVLTVEWLMHFMNGYMHGSSMVLAVNLVCILYQASLEFQSSFRSQNGYACACRASCVVSH